MVPQERLPSPRDEHEVRGLIEREPVRPDDQPDAVGWLQRLCRSATVTLPASGVGVSVLSEGNLVTAAASDPTSAIVEELQFTLGEGPCVDAYASRRPVLFPDLAEASLTRWQGYGPAAQEHGVRAVFAFPLQVGAARLGALDVYRDRVGGLSARSVAYALTFATIAMQTLLDAQQRGEDDEQPLVPHLEDALDTRFEVYQAQGMLTVQLGVSMADAMVRLRGYAFAQNRSISDVAADIVARRLVLEGDGPVDPPSAETPEGSAP